jgi:hypothetical protein
MKPKTDINDASTELSSGMKTALKQPQKFYYILLRSGLSANEAQDLMYDLKFPKLRMASPTARKKVIKTLTKLINTITSDPMLYTRFLSLSQSKKIFEMDTASANIPGVSTPEVFMNANKLLNYIKMNKRKKPKFDMINHTS